MVKRHDVEQKWSSTVQRIENYEKELTEWKAKTSKQVEEQLQKEKSIQKSLSDENTTLKDAIKLKDEEIKTKDEELKEKNALLKSKENQLRSLREQLERLSSTSSTNLLPVEEKEPESPTSNNVPLTLQFKRPAEEPLEGTIPFNSKRAGWLDTSAKSDAILEVQYWPFI
jgi:hypothetical protein